MGQSQSHPSLSRIDKQIAKTKRELFNLREEGAKQRQKYCDEMYRAEIEVYEVKMKLLTKGEEAKSLWNFWDYVKEVNQTLHTDSGLENPIVNTTNESADASERAPQPPSQSTAIVVPWYFFNIFSLFEAMLLRRLHIAMLLKKQRDTQSKAWNAVVVFLYDMIPGIKESAKKAKGDFEQNKTDILKNGADMQDAYEKQLLMQRELMGYMNAEPDVVSIGSLGKRVEKSGKVQPETKSAEAISTTSVESRDPSWRHSTQSKLQSYRNSTSGQATAEDGLCASIQNLDIDRESFEPDLSKITHEEIDQFLASPPLATKPIVHRGSGNSNGSAGKRKVGSNSLVNLDNDLSSMPRL